MHVEKERRIANPFSDLEEYGKLCHRERTGTAAIYLLKDERCNVC